MYIYPEKENLNKNKAKIKSKINKLKASQILLLCYHDFHMIFKENKKNAMAK